MAFPKKQLLYALIGTVLLYIWGMPGWVAIVFGTVGFLVTGGLNYCKLVVKTLPRDLKFGRILLGAVMHFNHLKKNRSTVADVFIETAKRVPNKIAIVHVHDNRQWTFKELNEYSNQVANYFRGLGFQKGDCVALFMDNCPEFIGIWLGLGKIGVVAAFINFNLRQEALAHCIRISGARAIVFSADLSDALMAELPELNPSLSDMCYSVSGDSSVPQAKEMEGELRGVSSSEPPPVAGKDTEDLSCYIYTSGTTGLPKACRIKCSRVFSFAIPIGTIMGVKDTDIIYCTLPLYHTNGGVLTTGQMIIQGCTIVLRRKFSASNFWTDCIKHKCTVTFYIGELCRYLLTQPKRPTDTQHCVRVAIGNGLRSQIWQSFQKRFQVANIREFYGSTEGNVGMANPLGKVGACGMVSVVLPFVNPTRLIKVDPETGKYVRDKNGFCIQAWVDEPGEVVGQISQFVGRGFDGYDNKEATQKKIMCNVFKPGDKYFLSGDILRMDEEGFMFFCDRTGDTFRWKGENVSTTEVEGTVASILELRDVIIYGVEIPNTEGRAGMAAIRGDDQTVDLSSLAQKLMLSLPSYAVPVFVRLTELADLTGNFKYKKVRLRNEGFDLAQVSDPLYMLDPVHKVYVPFTTELNQRLKDGAIRL